MPGSDHDLRNDQEDARGIERLLHFLAGGVVIFLLGAGVLVISAINQGSDSPATAAAAGPQAGTPVQVYIGQRHLALASAEGESTAIVSLREYVPDDGAQGIISGAAVLRYLVAAPGGAPEVTEDVARWRVDARLRAVEERDALSEQISSTQEAEFAQVAQQDVDRLNKLIQSLDAKGPVIFGAVVEDDAKALAKLVTHPKVRLVDTILPSPASDSTTRGVRPEEVDTAGNPPVRP